MAESLENKPQENIPRPPSINLPSKEVNQEKSADEKIEPAKPESKSWYISHKVGKAGRKPHTGSKPRRSSRALKLQFLLNFKGFVYSTCEEIDVNPKTFYRWMQADKNFAERVKVLETKLTENYEKKASVVALTGSERMLEFLLRARRPEIYKERLQFELDPGVADHIVTQFVAVIKKLAPDFCPHCKTRLDLPNKIAEELSRLSHQMAVSR